MSILLFSSSIGVLIGYIVTALMIDYMTWKWSFYIQILITIPLWIIISLTPKSYLELDNADEEAEAEAG